MKSTASEPGLTYFGITYCHWPGVMAVGVWFGWLLLCNFWVYVAHN